MTFIVHSPSSTRDNSRFLEQGTIQGHGLVSFSQSKGNLSGVLHGLAHQSIAAGEQEGFLNAGWVVANYVNY